MKWHQRFPCPVAGTKTTVSINVESYDEATNRQLNMFVLDLIRRGVVLSGRDDWENGKRVLAMEATT